MAAQPAAGIGLGQLHKHAVLGFFFRRGCGAFGRFGSGCALRGGLRSRCAAGAEEHSPEYQRHHGSDAHADADLCALARLFIVGNALEEQQNDGDQQDAVHDGQQDEPVGGIIHSCRNGDAVCLGVKDVVAGAAHRLLCGVGGGIHLDTHEAEHHVAAGTDGKVDVHPVSVAHGGVGDHHAVEAPLVAEHIGEQRLGSARPGVAKAAVTAHDSGGAALLDRKLKGLEVNFADGLLVCPDRDGQTVGLLIVQGKVLDVGVHALTAHALHHGSAHLAGQQAVLAVILEVTAGEGGAVDVHAGGVQTHHMVCGGLGAKGGAKALGKVGVPAGTHDDLAGEGNALQAADQTVDARRAVQIIGGGLAHAGNFRGGPAAVGDHFLADAGNGKARGQLGVAGKQDHSRLVHTYSQTALPQLDASLAALGMDGIGQFLQLGDVLVLCDGEEHLGRAEGVDGRYLHDIQSAAAPCAGDMVCNVLVVYKTILGKAGAHGRHDDAVAQRHVLDGNGRKQLVEHKQPPFEFVLSMISE